VLPGTSAVAIVSITAPKISASTFPVYSGFVEAESATTGETLSVSYEGLVAKIKDLKIIDDTDFFFGDPIPTLLDSTGNVRDGPTNYTFADDDLPSVLYR